MRAPFAATGAILALAVAVPPALAQRGPAIPAAGPASIPAQPPAAASGSDGLAWDNRPVVRYGDWFELDVRALLDALVEAHDPEPAGGGATFDWSRRRIGIQGTVTRYVEYEVDYGFDAANEETAAWRDVFVNVRPALYAQVQAGKFKIPFGYERLTGPRSLDFAYRSRVSDALTPGRSVGVMFHGRAFNRLVRYAVGAFQDDGDQPPDIEPAEEAPGNDPGTEGRTWAARATLAPLRLTSLKGKYNNLEIGGAYTRCTIPEGRNHLQGDTAYGGDFFGRHYDTKGARTRAGLEVSWAIGPASVAAEYIVSRDAREGQGVGTEDQLDNDLPAIEGRGWYVAGAWVLTGESRDGGVTPNRPLFRGGFGAVQVDLRYERLQFASAGAPAEPPSDSPRAANIAGNGDRAWTVGVTWYLNRWAKVRVNIINEDIEDAGASPVPGTSSLRTTVVQFQAGF
jgi:phosphate-selective porin OprO/OprP